MGHDSQVPQDEEMIPLPPELQERKNDLPNLSDKVIASLGLLADWWALYGQIYRDDPTDALLQAFKTILGPLLSKPNILNEALIVAARESPKFRPSPGRVFEIAETLMLRREQMPGNRPKYLNESRLTEAEREAAVAETPAALRAKLTGKVGA